MRGLVSINAADAPQQYSYKLAGDTKSLSLDVDGAVLVHDAAGDVVATVQAPWAVDANSKPVPTHYEVEGTTLIQVVEHQGGSYAYPIVADPALAPSCIHFAQPSLWTARVACTTAAAPTTASRPFGAFTSTRSAQASASTTSGASTLRQVSTASRAASQRASSPISFSGPASGRELSSARIGVAVHLTKTDRSVLLIVFVLAVLWTAASGGTAPAYIIFPGVACFVTYLVLLAIRVVVETRSRPTR